MHSLLRSKYPQAIKFLMIGTGFWAQYQLGSWFELFKELGTDDVQVLLCDLDIDRAKELAKKFNIPTRNCFDDVEVILDEVKDIKFIDILSSNSTHHSLVMQLASKRIPIICQKPLAETKEQVEAMLSVCMKNQVKLFVHENWRFQAPILKFEALLRENDDKLGIMKTGKIVYCNNFPVFENQPDLKHLEKFIVMDMGAHILDVARFIFGEGRVVNAELKKSRNDIRGEDEAYINLEFTKCSNVTVELSYARPVEAFPRTGIVIECEKGVIQLTDGNKIKIHYQQFGKPVNKTIDVKLPHYSFVEPDYALVQTAMPACQKSILDALIFGEPSPTLGSENAKTLELVFNTYEISEKSLGI